LPFWLGFEEREVEKLLEQYELCMLMANQQKLFHVTVLSLAAHQRGAAMTRWQIQSNKMSTASKTAEALITLSFLIGCSRSSARDDCVCSLPVTVINISYL
jgi:hypothetical protein